MEANLGLSVVILALLRDLTGGSVLESDIWLFERMDKGLNFISFSSMSCLIHSIFLFSSLNRLFLSYNYTY